MKLKNHEQPMSQEQPSSAGVNDGGVSTSKAKKFISSGVLRVGFGSLFVLVAQSGCGSQAEEPEIEKVEPAVSVGEGRTFGAEEIKSVAARLHQGPDTDRVIYNHVAAQAREGRHVDALNVSAAILGGGELAWEDGSMVEEARFLFSTSTDVVPGAQASTGGILELRFQATADAGMVDAPQDRTLVGPGMGSASYSGGTRLQSTCQTWTLQGRSITGCYQLFKPTSDNSSSRDYYAYNRWATAVGQGGVLPWYPVVVDVRSRPHISYASRVVGMSNYFPIDGSQLCNQGSSVNLSLGTLGLGIGLTNCGDKVPIPNAGTKTMGVIYDDGFVFGGPLSKGVDFEMEVFAWQGGATPIMGDYNYAKFCSGTLANCTGTLGKDGW